MDLKKQVKTFLGAMLLIGMLLINYSCGSDNVKTVLFDEGHGQLFKTGDSEALGLSKLSEIFLNDDWVVKTSDKELTDRQLKGIDILVISGAFKSISQSEIKAIVNFLDRGGKLSVMLHIGPPVTDLLHTLGVSISNGVIHEVGEVVEGHDIDFRVRDLVEHDLTNALKDYIIYGGWALLPREQHVNAIAETSENAWIDLNGDKEADAQQKFATIVVGTIGSGEFVIFSDDAIFQNNFLKGNNLLLGQNLVKWSAK
jgi:hypothetical protein